MKLLGALVVFRHSQIFPIYFWMVAISLEIIVFREYQKQNNKTQTA